MAKVLIVDDMESNLFALAHVLKKLDVEIIQAASGNEALRATLNHDFALAILDVQMPVMDGYELANLLRSDDRTRNIPIIFLSAVYSEEPYVFKGYEAGAVDFITKPFNPGVLLSKVRVFLEMDRQKAELVNHKERLEALVDELKEQADARARIELEILAKNTLLQGMNRLLTKAIVCETEEEFAKTCLAVAEELTGSKFGFIGEITEKGLFSNIAVSDPGWFECKMPRPDAMRLVNDMEIRGICGKVLKEGRAIVINDVSIHPDSTGIPDGHPSIETFIGVPLKKGDVTIGMIALANKQAGYDRSDLEILEPLATAFMEALSRKRAEEQVRRAHDELEERVRERTAELVLADRQLRAQATALEEQNQQLLSTIRELNRTQQALAESEERYRVMGDTIPYGVWMCDEKGRAEYVSPSFLQLLDMGIEDVKTSGWSDRLLPEDVRPATEEWLDCLCTGKPWEGEQKILDREGRIHTILTRGLPIRTENGEIKRWVGIHLDITERKRMEESLQLDEARLEALFEMSQMLELSRKEIADYALEHIVNLTKSKLAWLAFLENDSISDVQSWSRAAVEECAMSEKPPHANVGAAGIWAQAVRERKVVMVNDYAAPDPRKKGCPEGHVALNRLLCVPVFDRGQIVALGVVGNKSTDYDHSDVRQMSLLLEGMWKHIERQRADREKTQYVQRLELLNQELQDFAFIASHDLQEPLRKIQAFGDRLRNKCLQKLDETEVDYLVRMEGAANRMQDLIRELLKYSRVVTKSNPFRKVDLNEVVGEVVQIFELQLKHRNGRIDVSTLPVIDADPTQMKQLFQNLIGNSLKFQDEDRTPHVRVSSDCATEDFCRIIIEDNGIGFEERYSDRIFAPFQRLHNRSAYKGTGMGLAICRKIVERHGGEITVKSIPGTGTTFTVNLPLSQD